MSFLAIIGFIMIILIVALLLKGLSTPNVVFVVLPTIAALICGFAFKQLSEFVGKGLSTVLSTTSMLAFSIMFFAIMKDAGVFTLIIKAIFKVVNNSVRSILFATLIISAICSLDGNAVATLLITVPIMAPIYDKMKISRKTLFMMIACGVGATGVTPWGGSMARAIAVVQVDPIQLYHMLIPVQIVALILGFITAFFVAKKEVKNGAGISDEEFIEFKTVHLTNNLKIKSGKTVLVLDCIITVLTIVILTTGAISTTYLFMMAVAIVLPLNYPNAKDAQKKIKDLGGTILPVVITFFAIGVFIGILQNTKMMNDMVMALVSLFPESFGPHIYIVMAALSVPIVIAFGSDAFYFALLPLVAGVAIKFGVSGLAVTAALLITEQVGLLLSPAIAATQLGLSLIEVEIGEHIKHSYWWIWGISLISLVFAVAVGIIPL